MGDAQPFNPNDIPGGGGPSPPSLRDTYFNRLLLSKQPADVQPAGPTSQQPSDNPAMDHAMPPGADTLPAAQSAESIAPNPVQQAAAVGSTALPPPQPTGATVKQNLLAQAGLINAAADSAQAKVQAALTAAAAPIAGAAINCSVVVRGYFDSELKALQANCGNAEVCIRQNLHNIVQSAAEYATHAGCNLAQATSLAQSFADSISLGQTAPGNLAIQYTPPVSPTSQPVTFGQPVETGGGPATPPSMQGQSPGGLPLEAPTPPLTPAQPPAEQPMLQGQLPPQLPPNQPLGGFGQPTAEQCANLGPPPPPGPAGIMVPDAAIQAAFNGPPVSVTIPACGGPTTLGASGPGGGQGTLVYFPATGQGFLTVGNHGIPYGVPAATVANANWYYMNCLCLAAGLGVGGGGGPPPPSPPQPPPSQCPPPPQCPVCQKPGCDCSCFDQCQKKKPPTPTQWCVWQSSDGTCYVLTSDKSPNAPGDQKQGCYDNQTEAELNAEKCQKQPQQPPSPPPVEAGAPTWGEMWCNPEICAEIDNMSMAFDFQVQSSRILAVALGERPYVPADVDHSCDNWPFGTKWVGIGIYAPLYTVAAAIGYVVTSIRTQFECFTPLAWSLAAWRCLARWAGAVLGDGVGRFGKAAEYWQNYLCPQQIPTSADADSCLLSNSITTAQWECWVAANNDCPQPRGAVIDSKRQRLGVTENVALFMRDEIDLPTYHDNIRQLGFLDTEQADQYLTLAQQIPPVSELIRMMVRDVADEGLVTKFGLDAEFTDKWVGQLKQWGANQGIPDLFAKYEWRAHWSIPSPGQLYQMYHRLRKLDPADPNYVDVETLKEALAQQDILPYWQGKFIAISFNPLTRIDAGRAYEVGAVDQDRLHQAYTDLGYTDDDATTLVEFKRRQLAVRMRTLPVVGLFRKGLISRPAATEMLTADNYPADLIEKALDYTWKIFQSQSTAACVKSLKKRFMLGEVSAIDLPGDLMNLGQDPSQAQSTASAWNCERTARGKLAPAAMLCKWFKQGIITQEDYVMRLDNLGWSADDTANHLALCQAEIDAEKLKQQLADKKAKEKAAKQALAEAEKLAKQQQQQAEKMAKLALQEAKLSRKQFQRINQAVMYLVKAGGMDWMTAYTTILDGINYGISRFQLDWQAAIDAAYKAAYATTAKTVGQIQSQLEQAMRAEWLAFQEPAVDGSEVL